MRHDWVFDVLADLRSYAQRNGLPRLAEQAEMTLRMAREEVEAQSCTVPETETADGGTQP